MESQVVNSVLSVNNHFYKVFKRIIDKRKKNESISDEIEWINAQLLHENRKICENAVNVLIQFGVFDFILASNSMISALSRTSNCNYDLIGDGIFKLLQKVNSKFGINEKPHPAILMISDSSENMLYLSKKIEDTFENKFHEDPECFLRPVLIMALSSDTIYPESREIWRQILKHGKDSTINEILSLRRVTSPPSCLLFNSMVTLKFNVTRDFQDLLLLIASTKYLVEYFLDPTKNIEIMMANLHLFEENKDMVNVAMILLAEILQRTSVTYVPKLVEFLKVLIVDKKYLHPIVLSMVLDGLIQVIAYPSFASKNMKNVEKLLNYIRTESSVEAPSNRPNFQHFNSDVCCAYDVCQYLDLKRFDFRIISTEYERIFWRRHQLLLRGFLHSHLLNYNQWQTVLKNLIEISKADDELKNSLVMPLLFKMSESSDPKMRVSILQNLTSLGASTEVFSTIKALSDGMLRSMAIELHLRLWKIEPRLYPFLYKILVEKSNKDYEDTNLNIIRASVIKEICDLKPHHGSDLVTVISDILNQSLDSKENEIPAALAIDAIIILCQNHIINITSTWKAISLTTRYEKRSRVVTSLCNFFALIPKFKRNNSEYEMLTKDIVARIFHMIQWSDTHGIKCALEALKSWNYDLLTLDMIPDTFREGIALPDAPAGMEVSILDLEVPGECYIQLLTKINPSALRHAGDLISHFISQEISEYRSGHYIVKEGQPEPSSYKNLPKQSILKAMTQFVIQQATTKKKEKIVADEILIEALRVLSQQYSRPLPPLSWTFLHELVHRGQETKTQCMALVTKQSVISGTAKRLAENMLINIDFDELEDVEASLNILADLCNGVSNDVLKIFFEKAVENANINVSLQKCLNAEKNISNRENLATIISIYVRSGKNISADTFKLIPPNIMPMLSLDPKQRIQFRCEILKENSTVENSVGWMNELIAEQYIQSDNREFLVSSFIDLLTENKQAFPKKKWLSEFMTMTENKMIEEGDLDFLLDIFCTAMICFSGYFEMCGKCEIFNNRMKMLPQAIELVSSQALYNEIIGSIFDFIYFVIEHKSTADCYQEAFKKSIISSKNHPHFKKSSKTWFKILQAIGIPK